MAGELYLGSGVLMSPQVESALALLIVDIAVMLLLATAMLSAARLYLADRIVIKPADQAIVRHGGTGKADR